jgi:SdrD B-like domain
MQGSGPNITKNKTKNIMFQTNKNKTKNIFSNLVSNANTASKLFSKGLNLTLTTLLMASIAFGGSTMLRAFAEPIPSVQTNIRAVATGVAPFDLTTFDVATAADAGTDANITNNVVRMGDYITYRVDVNLNGKDTTNLVSTVTLDSQADWTDLPTSCLKTGVSPVSSISADKKTLTCNLAKDVVQGTKMGYDVVARSNTNGKNATTASLGNCVTDLGCIRATTTAIADGAAQATGNNVDTLITTKFEIDLSKTLPGEDPSFNPPKVYIAKYNLPNAANTANGNVIVYDIQANANPGSEKVQGDANGKVSFVLTDTFSTTDPVGNVLQSSLYDWEAGATGCDKVGTAITGTLTCTQPGGPGTPITITINDVDTTYPDGTGKLFHVQVSLWVPVSNILTSQDCIDNYATLGSCNISIRNVITGIDFPTSAPYSNAAGATSGNRLRSITGIPNYNGVNEPTPNNIIDYRLKTNSPGPITFYKAFYNPSLGVSENPGTKTVAKGDIVPTMIRFDRYGAHAEKKHMICDKIDTANFEFNDLTTNGSAATSYGGTIRPNSDILVTLGTASSYYYYFSNTDLLSRQPYDLRTATNPNGQMVIEYSNAPSGTGSLADLASDSCADTDGWYSNYNSVPGGKSAVTKVRLTVLDWELWRNKMYQNLGLTSIGDLTALEVNFTLKVKNTAIGYGPNNWLPNYAYQSLDDVSFGAVAPAQLDPTNPNFAVKAQNGSADRVVLVANTMGITKDSVPTGKINAAPGETVEYEIKPQLNGLLNTPIDLTLEDVLPGYSDYIPGSLVVSDPGTATYTSTTVSTPGFAVQPFGPGNGDYLNWKITGLTKSATDTLPTFRVKIKFKPSAPTGTYANNVYMSSSDPVINATAGTDNRVEAAKSLKITAPDGYRVTKTELRDLYEVNEKIAFDLNYSRTGASAYSPGDFIDILPFNGDNSTSAFVKREDTLTPNTATASNYTNAPVVTAGLASVPTGTNGEVFQYTTAPSNTIPLDPCHSANQPAGYVPATATAPCYLQYTLNGNKFVDGATTGTGTIVWTTTAPALDTVTAIRWATTAHTVGQPTRTVNVVLQPKGNKQGDIYCNNFAGRIPEISLQITSNDVCAKVVSGSISGYVWKDLDANATATNTQLEPVISGAIVNLLVKDGTGAYVPYLDPTTGVAVTATTDGNGFYTFKELPHGTYRTEVTSAGTYGTQTYDNNTPAVNPNNSGDIVLDGPAVTATTLDVTDATQVNFSYTPLAKLSGYVYEDNNNDGNKDTGEAAIDGVTITLFKADGITPATYADGSAIPAVTTNAMGFYEFLNLPAGEYVVVETQAKASATTATTAFPVGTTYIDGKDTIGTGATTSQGNATTNDKISAVKLVAGDSSVNNNFGELKPAQLSGYVYYDLNNDGIKGAVATELQISGTTINLVGTDINGVTVNKTTTTDIDGFYSFTNLLPGTYYVEELQPVSYNDGKDSVGTGAATQGILATIGTGAATKDSQGNINLAAGNNSINNNFGEVKLATISGFEYVDTNNDGIKDAAELPIAGVFVTLTSTSNPAFTPITVQTDALGAYSFANLPAGTYVVTTAHPAAYLDGKDTASTSLTTNGTAAQDDKITAIVVAASESSPNNNFGELQSTSISGYNYVDTNNDGIKDAAETPIAGTLVTLTGPGLATPLTTFTDATGAYSFLNLAPGTYTVTMAQPAAYPDGKDTSGTGATTAGTTAQDDKIVGIVLASGQASINNNFGELPAALPAKLSGFVYVDANNDGIKDATELPIAGVPVTIKGGTLPAAGITVLTDATGFYEFPTLAAGTYTVTELQPAAYPDGKDTAGTGAATQGTITNDTQTGIVLAAGQNSINNNFGELPAPTPAKISGFEYVDTNNDGIKDAAELAIPGTVVTLTGGTLTAPMYTVTDALGFYEFANLPAGTYSVSVPQPATYNDGKDTASTSLTTNGTAAQDDKITAIVVAPGETSANNNFGELVKPVVPGAASISGFNYVDTANFGTKDVGEAPIAGTTVTLTKTDGTPILDNNGVAIPASLTTVTTGTDGSYTFTNLAPGSYIVTMGQNPTYDDGLDTASTSLTTNGAVAQDDKVTAIVVAASEVSANNNFGELVKPVVTTSSTASSIASSSTISSITSTASSVIAPVVAANSGGVITINVLSTASTSNSVSSVTSSSSTVASVSSGLSSAVGPIEIQSNTTSVGIDRSLDLKDPYVCSSHVYGIVNTNPKVKASVNLEFSQGGKVVKTYTLTTNDDGTWRQDLDTLAYGFYNYKVVASFENLSDSESFDIDHKAFADCSATAKADLIRTGGYSPANIALIVVLMVVSALGFSLKFNKEQE